VGSAWRRSHRHEGGHLTGSDKLKLGKLTVLSLVTEVKEKMRMLRLLLLILRDCTIKPIQIEIGRLERRTS
jgi:hypothetical protein